MKNKMNQSKITTSGDFVHIKPWVTELVQLMQREFETFITHIPENKRAVATHLKE